MTMDYKKKYNQALERAKKLQENSNGMILKKWLVSVFPELAESEDERIRKGLIKAVSGTMKGNTLFDTDVTREEAIAWLEKQKDTNVLIQEASEKAYTEGMRVEREHWLEKQGTPAKLDEEEQNKFAKGVLTSCAMSFINYLDAHKYDSKMCVSNGECEDIENAFHNAMWDRLHRYYCKYIEKQGDKKPAWSKEDEYVVKELGGILYNAYGISDDEREMCTNWLKSIEGRVQPPMEVWSGKDEDKFNKVIDELTPFGECPDNPDWEERVYYHGRDSMIEWLKSLRTRLGGK